MPRGPFQGVCLVHDEGSIVPEDPRFGLLIAQEEGVVDDDQVGTPGMSASGDGEAVVVELADRPEAARRIVVQPVPQLPGPWIGEEHAVLLYVPCIGLKEPSSERGKVREEVLLQSFDYLPKDHLPATQTQVIPAPLEKCDLGLWSKKGEEERKVLLIDLFLKLLGASGEDKAGIRVIFQVEEGGHEVGEGLSRSGACLDNECSTLLESSADLCRHLTLAGTILERGHCLCHP